MVGFLGEVKMFAGNFAPRGWTYCEGQLLSIAEYNALFAILGTQYGGDGRVTFGVPDLRGRTPIGQGQGPGLTTRIATQMGGWERIQLTVNQLPAHTHAVNCDMTSDDRTSNVEPEGRVPTKAAGKAYGSKLQGGHQMHDSMINATGSSDTHENMQPWIAMRYIMCIEGEFPSRP